MYIRNKPERKIALSRGWNGFSISVLGEIEKRIVSSRQSFNLKILVCTFNY